MIKNLVRKFYRYYFQAFYGTKKTFNLIFFLIILGYIFYFLSIMLSSQLMATLKRSPSGRGRRYKMAMGRQTRRDPD